MLDEVSRRILRHFQNDPELGTAELAAKAGVSPAICARRLDRLRSDGVLLGQVAQINWAALGYAVEVSLRFTLDKTQRNAFDDFIEQARKVPEVLEIQTFLGRVDVRLTVLARDMVHYQDIYRDRILTLPHISDIQALMQISTIKSTEALPL
ncbi:MAG: AsnC family transcriptional regulator [Rhodobacterales bacterium]|nr:MAG: AsnC family transcriptional regulator [Rhodobacterales bacterium]